MSTGMGYRPLAFSFKVSHNTISRIVVETCEAIWKKSMFIHMPPVTTDILAGNAARMFQRWRFPNCVRCIDGKHIRIRQPAHSGTDYYNYKGHFSIIMQAIADEKCRFTSIDVGAFGRQSDGGVFQNSQIYQDIEVNHLMPPDKPLP